MKNKASAYIFLVLSLFVFTGCSLNKAGEYYKKGAASFNEGKYAQASQYFKNAVEIKDDKAEYYISYGMSLIMEKKYDLAREQFKRAIVDKVNSIVIKNNQQAYRGLGICDLREGQYENAILNLNEALKINGEEEIKEDIRCYLCEAYIKLEDYKSAGEVIEAQLAIKETGDAYGMRGWVYFMAGEYKEAAADFEKALSMEKGGRPEWYLFAYQSLIKNGENNKAGEYLQKALKIKVKDEEDKIIMARLLMASGDIKAAKDSFGEMSAKNPKAFYYLGVISQEEENYADAAANYDKYEKSCAENGDAAEDLYLRLGMSREALWEYYLNQDMENEAENNSGMALLAYKKGMEHGGPYKKELYLRSISLCERMGDYEGAYGLAKEYLKEDEDERIKREKQFLETRVSKGQDVADG